MTKAQKTRRGGGQRTTPPNKQLLHLVQRCIVHVESTPADSKTAELRSSLEALYNLANSLINGNEKSYEEYRHELHPIVESTGASNIADCLHACLGIAQATSIKRSLERESPHFLDLLFSYSKPFRVRYIACGRARARPVNARLDKTKAIKDDDVIEKGCSLDCIDLARSEKEFGLRVSGIDVLFKDQVGARWIVVSCRVQNICPSAISSQWLSARRSSLRTRLRGAVRANSRDLAETAVDLITLKEYIVYSDADLSSMYCRNLGQVGLLIDKPIAQVANEFLALDKYRQRKQLLQLLIRDDSCEYYYTAYLLYDLLSTEDNVMGDTHQQLTLLGSLPWKARLYFKEAMVRTVEYTDSLMSGEEAKIPLAQQVCLLKASDRTKSKAMSKLREVKAKSEDSGAKARQYLEGLLRIPFGQFRTEEILQVCEHNGSTLDAMRSSLQGTPWEDVICKKDNYGTCDVNSAMLTINSNVLPALRKARDLKICELFGTRPRSLVVERARVINETLARRDLVIPISGSIKTMASRLGKCLENEEAKTIGVLEKLGLKSCSEGALVADLLTHSTELTSGRAGVVNYMDNVRSMLDQSVHGHSEAKRQVERIIGQWMTGKPGGYCFGFEGPPGVGKTSLAKKGIADCLKNAKGEPRPFSFIAVGGASNSSTLDGHNYTYVGSTWGRIVDTVMEAGCLNPIIFIDELDKISRTEHGKEIIGILTHLVDPSQNDGFQDKYFAGIDIDLSNALIIFSYNDASLIDRILLDRIHRVEFNALNQADKIIICRKHLIPELCDKMGLPPDIVIPNDALDMMIAEYTYEPGVRALKGLLFEVLGELNLAILNGETFGDPITLTTDQIRKRFLKTRTPCHVERVPLRSQPGRVCGLWASSLGVGGLLHIQVKTSTAVKSGELKLTGKQGDVMKESMAVAHSVAIGLLKELGKECICSLEEEGFHVHIPEAATPKDGPSAGTAITTALYSLMTGIDVDKDVGVTGEICLEGDVKAVGGLEAKISGAIRAGAKKVLYPYDNKTAVDALIDRGKVDAQAIVLVPIKTIHEALEHLLLT